MAAERAERIAQLEARVRDLKARESKDRRKQETREKIVIGGAVVAEAKADPEFQKQLLRILQKRVTRPLDAAAVKSWLTTI